MSRGSVERSRQKSRLLLYESAALNDRIMTRKALLWFVVGLVVIIAALLYRARFVNNRLNVEPHAREEIEKAKKR
jgi:hypothetical protein